jgi:hypothetical protein
MNGPHELDQRSRFLHGALSYRHDPQGARQAKAGPDEARGNGGSTLSDIRDAGLDVDRNHPLRALQPRHIPYILYIKSSGSSTTWVAPDGDGYGLREAQEVP